MINKIVLSTVILLAGIWTSAIAQEKVVVIPLNSNKAAGTDGQFQYNDGGRNAGSEVYYDKNNGNVGFGTSSPGKELHIIGPDTPAIRLDQQGGSWPPQIWDVTANEAYFYIRDITHGSASPFRIQPGAPSYSITVVASGNVGIGTASPQGKLDVNGAIYQRNVVLHADYVFAPEYKLESIEDHSRFMWQEKHLKAVPKVQYDENGLEILEVGAHRKGMLEELEKAHIYIDQLNAKMKEQNTEIAALKSLVCQDHQNSVACK